MPTQAEKAADFEALHQRTEPFVIGNPWDAGTARMLTGLGFPALSTTSAGLAFTLGRRDGVAAVSTDEALANARSIVDATTLPVAADLENGYGHTPEAAAETIRLAAETGLVGGSIEDASGDPEKPIYDFDHSVERIAAAVAAARRLPFPFMLVARAENYLHGRPDLSKPVNVLMGIKGAPPLSVKELGALGVRRISLGSAFSRAALTAFYRAAREVADHGTFTFSEETFYMSELMDLFK